jgi:hypothetical protein
MSTQKKIALSAGLIGVFLLGLGTSPLLAQVMPPRPAPEGSQMSEPPVTHEQMHQMMDAMHGEGTSQRMHEAMGAEGDKMMDQCVAMMNMMMRMSGMMGGGMPGMMGSGGMPGMMGGHNGPMPNMMDRMMGR